MDHRFRWTTGEEFRELRRKNIRGETGKVAPLTAMTAVVTAMAAVVTAMAAVVTAMRAAVSVLADVVTAVQLL